MASKRKRHGRIAGAGLVALDVVVLGEGQHGALAYAGGTCGNVLSILSYLNWNSTAVGFLGDDTAGRLVEEDLAKAGVSARYLRRRAESNTPVFVQQLRMTEQGLPKHTFASSCPSCGQPLRSRSARVTPINRFPRSEAPDVFFMDRLSDDILMLAESAKAQGAVVFYEPSVKSDQKLWRDAFSLIDIVKYSGDRFAADELEAHTRRADLWEIQTLGAAGLQYRRRAKKAGGGSNWTRSAAISAPRLVDTCGAGDWCTSGLLHGLMSYEDRTSDRAFANAVRFGQVLGAWACAFVGARGAMYANDISQTWRALEALSTGREVDMSHWPSAESQKASKRRYCPTDSCATN